MGKSPEIIIPEIDRETMVKMLIKYLKTMDRVYETKAGGEKHLAENIIDNGEQKCDVDIVPAKQYLAMEEIRDKDTGFTMTVAINILFSHINATRKKIIDISGH